MKIPTLVHEIHKTVRDNSPSILTALGVSGAIGTAYLTGVASWRASRRMSEGPPIETLSNREIVEEVWDLYIPPVVSGAVTVACIIGANHISSKRAAAAYSFAVVTEKAFTEYREKVYETLGDRKEKAIRDEIAQERVLANPPSGQVIISGSGTVLCYEMFTGRYFESDMETIRKAENTVNSKIIHELYATLNDFYHLVGLPHTSESGNLGWDSDKLLVLEYTTTMSEDSRPCLAFSYNYTKPL